MRSQAPAEGSKLGNEGEDFGAASCRSALLRDPDNKVVRATLRHVHRSLKCSTRRKQKSRRGVRDGFFGNDPITASGGTGRAARDWG